MYKLHMYNEFSVTTADVHVHDVHMYMYILHIPLAVFSPRKKGIAKYNCRTMCYINETRVAVVTV